MQDPGGEEWEAQTVQEISQELLWTLMLLMPASYSFGPVLSSRLELRYWNHPAIDVNDVHVEFQEQFYQHSRFEPTLNLHQPDDGQGNSR
jgi:hypothetical protein